MNEQLYLIDPTKEQWREWIELQYRMRSLSGICQNRMVMTKSEIDKHSEHVADFIAKLGKLNDKTVGLFKPVAPEEAKALVLDSAISSEEVTKILGIEKEKLPF